MARDIERDGARFYRTVARQAAASEAAELLLRLAEMEDDHEKSFAAMVAALPAEKRNKSVFDPDGEEAQYLQTLVEGKVFEPANGSAERLTGKETLADILRIAIDLEKDSILFYVGMKGAVTGPGSRDTLEKIIQEEMSHISLLQEELRGRA